MRICFLAVAVFFVAGVVAAAPVKLAPSPDWQPAPETQRAALPQSPNLECVDFSLSDAKKAYGLVVYSGPLEPMNRQLLQETVETFERSVSQSGQTILQKKPATFRDFRGQWFVTRIKAPAGELYSVSLLLCGERDVLTVTVGHVGSSIDEQSELVTKYLSRLEFQPGFKPGDVERDRAVVRTVMFSKQAGGLAAILVGVAALIALGYLAVRKFVDR